MLRGSSGRDSSVAPDNLEYHRVLWRSSLLQLTPIDLEHWTIIFYLAPASGHAHRSVVCFARVTNNMAQTECDFEKGDADGATATLAVHVRGRSRDARRNMIVQRLRSIEVN